MCARRAYLMLSAAALVLTACGSAPKAAGSSHPAHSGAVVATTPAAPAPAATPLIADTAADAATCHQFAAEQAGQISADQFNDWLLRHGGQPTLGADSSTGLDNTLSTTLGDWYVVLTTAPSGDLQPASYYGSEVRAACRSIGA
jgi:hypothetical protein